MGGGTRSTHVTRMVHPGRGARAQYTREYKRHLDDAWRPDAMARRLRAAATAVAELRKTLRAGEPRIAKTLARSTPPPSPFTLDDLRAHVAAKRRMVRKLADLPPAPPVRWAKMRSIEMAAYRRELRAFDKWERRVAALEADAVSLRKTLAKLVAPRAAPAAKDRVDAVCTLAGAAKGTRRYYVLVKS